MPINEKPMVSRQSPSSERAFTSQPSTTFQNGQAT